MSNDFSPRPPFWANRFLEWYCSNELVEEIQGDLFEAFRHRYKNQGMLKARLMFIIDVIKFFKPYSLRKSGKNINQMGMFRNYIKISFRNIKSESFYSSINIIGLAIGLAISILIVRFVKYEQSYDVFHSNFSNIYRVHKELKINDFDLHKGSMTPYVLGYNLKDDIPDVTIGRIGRFPGMLSVDDEKYIEDNVVLAEPEILEIFDIEFISGNPENALDESGSILLTEASAAKYFPDESPLGKIISRNAELDLRVTGIVKEMPTNSHFHFDFLVSMESAKSVYSKSKIEHWGSTWTWTYVMLPGGYSQEELDYQLEVLLKKYLQGQPFVDKVRFLSMPLKDIHLNSGFPDEFEQNGNLLMVYGSSISALIIILIACFNFMNLTTARSTKKIKEVGVRKTIGAKRSSLVLQFLIESFMVTFIAAIFAIAIAQLIGPLFSQLIARDLPLGFGAFEFEILWILGISIVVAILAGSYPAFYLSRFSPIVVLSGSSKSGKMLKAAAMRRVLVTLQFIASIVLIAATVVVYNQLDFIRAKELGYDTENILIVKINNESAFKKAEFLRQRFSQISAVSHVSLASNVPSDRLNSWRLKSLDPTLNIETMIKVISIDPNYLDLMNMNLVEGRNFNSGILSDKTDAIILNEAAVKVMGLDDPLGTEFNVMDGMAQAKVIGVVEDFHLNSLHEEIDPLLIKFHEDWYWKLILKTQSGDLEKTIQTIENEWNAQITDWPLELSFLDDRLEQQYQADSRLGKAFMYFSILAILIACMGLFGLASFTTEQKVKEIGIRKALGASIGNILPLIYREFMMLVLIAFIIAIPFAWYLMDSWLQNFAFHISLSWQIFLTSGVLAAVIAILTIGYHSLKAAKANPVDSLRYE